MAAKDLAAKDLADVKLRNMVVRLPVIFILASIGSRSFPCEHPLAVQSVLTMS